jgi:hypothetical protein
MEWNLLLSISVWCWTRDQRVVDSGLQLKSRLLEGVMAVWPMQAWAASSHSSVLGWLCALVGPPSNSI